MTFTLKITLGNEAMQSYADIADALQRMLREFDTYEPITDESANDGVIKDLNGNTVGKWYVI